jgi:hypothetical protein
MDDDNNMFTADDKSVLSGRLSDGKLVLLSGVSAAGHILTPQQIKTALKLN